MDTEIYQEGNQTMILVDEAKTTDSREEVMNKSIQFYKQMKDRQSKQKDRQSKQKEENSHDEKTKCDQTNIQKARKIHNLLNQRLIKQLHLLKRI